VKTNYISSEKKKETSLCKQVAKNVFHNKYKKIK